MAAAAADPDWAQLPDDIIRDIFVRLRPTQPRYIFRVRHLCKDWLRALSDPDFARRLRDHDVFPPPVGFFHGRADDRFPVFMPTVPSAFSPTNLPDRRAWKLLDYRHGRALFLSRMRDIELGRRQLLVWDPITGVQQRVPVPPQASENRDPGAAVVCVAPGCDHCPGCSGGDFNVVFVFADPPFPEFDYDGADADMRCFVYSSQVDTWTDVGSIQGIAEDFGSRPSVLAGNSLYLLSDGLLLFEFDMADHVFSQIALPDMDDRSDNRDDTIILVLGEDGRLGIVEGTDGNLIIWSSDTESNGNMSWSVTQVFDHFDLDGEFGLDNHFLLGFAEGPNVIFLSTSEGVFSFELPSGLVTRVLDDEEQFDFVLPVVSFHASHNRLQQIEAEQEHDQPNPLEDSLQLAGHLFIKGCNDIEKRGFDSAIQAFGQCLEIRIGHYGNLAPECASTFYGYGCALLYKAQEVTNLDGKEGDLDLSWEMLETARLIVLKNPGNTLEIADVVSAQAEILMLKEKKERTLTKSTEAEAGSTKQANVMSTHSESPRKRHRKSVDPDAMHRSSHDSGMQSAAQSD